MLQNKPISVYRKWLTHFHIPPQSDCVNRTSGASLVTEVDGAPSCESVEMFAGGQRGNIEVSASLSPIGYARCVCN